MDIKQAEQMVKRYMAGYGLTARGWSFRWRGGGAPGMCAHGPNVISLSKKVAATYDADVVSKIALHEIAHALCEPREGHGRKWREMARRIGGYDTPVTTLPRRRTA